MMNTPMFVLNIKDKAMRGMKNFLAIVLILVLTFFLTRMSNNSDYNVMAIVAFVLGAFFILNLALRRSIASKPYFTSKYNFLTSKFRTIKSYDISQQLMFDKIIEVIGDTKFKLVDTDEESCELLALSSITFKSWGENLYINLKPEGDKTVMHFCSVTLLQMYDWGKNEQNSKVLLKEIEDSFVI